MENNPLHSEEETLALIAIQAPEVHPQVVSPHTHAMLCHTMARMALMTVKAGRQGDLKKVTGYFRLADGLLQAGEQAVRTTVAQIYLGSLLNAFSQSNPLSQLLPFLFPPSLRMECQKWFPVQEQRAGQ